MGRWQKNTVGKSWALERDCLDSNSTVIVGPSIQFGFGRTKEFVKYVTVDLNLPEFLLPLLPPAISTHMSDF